MTDVTPARQRIPFNRATCSGNEMVYIAQAITNGHISGDGEFTKRCQALLEAELGAPKVLLTGSCTSALEMTALLLDFQPGDEFIVPTFTFVTTASAGALRGARPIFADSRADTLNLDETKLERLITPKTKAIYLVHYAGIGCEMDQIMAIANRHGLPVIEDNAHALFGAYRGQQLGTFGSLATQSFHETKNITCGEGGALVINDPALIERAEIVREKGTNRSRFFRGQVDKYTWVDLGSSFLLSDAMAGFLLAQLEQRERIQAQRQAIWQRYDDHLGDWAERRGVRLPVIPAHCDQAYHMYYLIMPSLADRTRFINYMKERDILCVFHYIPLNLSDMGRKFGAQPGDCPVAEAMSDRLVRLPFYNSLSPEEQDRVIAAIREFH